MSICKEYGEKMKTIDKNVIIEGDCLEVMKSMNDNSVDLIITSPPYPKKKAYFVQEDGADYGVAVVATSSREAKKIGFSSDVMADAEWTDIRVQWKRSADVSKLKIGIIEDYLLALKLGIYGYVDLEECPNCNTQDTTVYYENGGYYCSHCEQ